MSITSRMRTWWRALAGPASLDRDLDEELRFHIESQAEDLVRQGVPPSEAVRRARAELGSVAAGKEQCRQAWGARPLDDLRADVRYALRQLGRSPGFTAIAIGSLALGIGVNTAIFSVARAVLLDRLHVPRPGELRLLAWQTQGHPAIHSEWGDMQRTADGTTTTTSFSYPVFEQLQRQNAELGVLFGFKNIGRLNVTAGGEAEVVQGDLVSGNFYQQMEIQPQRGRALGPADDHPGAVPVAVISDGYWETRFNRSDAAVGSTILVNLVPVTIVGVNPPGFTGAKGTLISPELFMPFAMQPAVSPYSNGESLLTGGRVWWMQIMARAKPGVDEGRARAALDSALKNAARATLTIKEGESLPDLKLTDGSRGLNQSGRQFALPLWSLMALVGLVLLLACANMANLLLSRSAARQREMSVRLAMGAGRGRIARQMLTESLLLAALGGLAGLAAGWLGRKAILVLFSTSTEPMTLQAAFDWGIFAFDAALSLATGLLFGAAPAWQALKTPVSTTFKDVSQTTTRRRRGLTGRAIVAFQVALSTLLVVAAGIFLRTLVNLDNVNPGFDTSNLVLFELRPPQTAYTGPKQIRLFRQIAERLAAVPGVESVTPTTVAPLANNYENDDFVPEGAGKDADGSANTSTVGDGFFQTFRIPIVAGRGFTSADTETSQKVAVVNQALVRQFFPKQNAISKSFSTSDVKNNKLVFQIVGICADSHYGSLREPPPPVFYLNYRQAPEADWGVSFAVRTHLARAAITPALRRAVSAVDPNLPVVDIRTQREQIDDLLRNERVFADLAGGFGVLALVLACIGIYGIAAFSVAQRTNEIGIRMALGAQAAQVARMVLRESAGMTVVGVVAGLGAALGLGRVVASMLYGLKPWDPATLAASALLLFAVALAATWIPARRAAAVDPMRALRHD
jgi:predicted permease